MKIPFSDYAWGAGAATGLVNTSALVRTSTGEVLTDPAALAAFLAEHRLGASHGAAAPTDADLARVLALRQETRALLEAEDEDEVVAGANGLVARVAPRTTLLRDDAGAWEWFLVTPPDCSAADELAALIGTGLLGALRTLSHNRFRPCSSPVCHGLFVDTSKAGRRRYCMPGLCGNRLNVASHRARRQATERPAGS
ncbi:CGNR zinc finger domain-containing protein [Streptomyces sp. BG2AG]|uniref:CGNR zinc finger domain-containing protein n=1 Tax=Streptomyces TaxID=1883 RepID=UPI0015876137|nr:CGNR zinc finger domain-containing protein [Streptomyces sp. CAI-155]